ncbi:MAG: porin [Bacteroides sp.]|nr:porin [Bacteroides sp.]
MKKRSILILLIALLPLATQAQEPSTNEDGKKINKEKLETKDYMPEIHGTIRSKYEFQTTTGAGRFEVRNARVSFTGNILPSVAYKAEIDLSDEGNIKMLDAYARLFPAKGLTVTAGQMRVPFTIDAHRSPHQQYFANRSFIAKQVGNVRDVGLTVGYKLPTDMPISLEGGLYNGKGLTNQKNAWSKELCYSAKAEMFFTKGLNLTLSVQSIQPTDIRMQSYDIGAYYETGRFHIEGEYLFKTYEDNAFDDVQAVNAFVNYDLPLKKGPFQKMSFLVRYDMMTDYSDAEDTELGDNGKLAITDYKRQRLTGGITFSLSKAFRTDLRLNYEKYFYAKNSIAATSEQDKIVLELMIRF